MTAVVSAAFAIGALTGFGLPRILDGASPSAGGAGTIAGQAFRGVTENNMSDAADQAAYAATVATQAFRGVAENNTARTPWFPGVAKNNMSDPTHPDQFVGN